MFGAGREERRGLLVRLSRSIKYIKKLFTDEAEILTAPADEQRERKVSWGE
jgi:hypothetical protein